MKNAEQDIKTAQVDQVDIGTILHSKRQEKKLTIQEASERTKLSHRIIEQLEMGRFEEIGTAVYVRGYLSLYAKFLELDAAKLISLYNEQHPPESTALRPAINPKTSAKQQTRRHSKALSFLVAVLVFFALISAYMKIEPSFLQNDGTDFKETESGLVEQKRVTNYSESSDNSLATEKVEEKELEVSEILNQADGVQELADKVLKETNSVVAPDNESRRNDTPKLVLESASDLPDVADDDLQKNIQDTTAKSQLKIQFRLSDDCWIKIVDSDKKQVLSNTYPLGKQVEIVGDYNYPLTIITWRPEAVKNFKINNQAIALNDYKIGDNKFLIKKPK